MTKVSRWLWRVEFAPWALVAAWPWSCSWGAPWRARQCPEWPKVIMKTNMKSDETQWTSMNNHNWTSENKPMMKSDVRARSTSKDIGNHFWKPADFFLERVRSCLGQVHRHEGLQVAHLGSHLAGNEANIGEHLAAVNAVLETRRNGVDISNRLQYIYIISSDTGSRYTRGQIWSDNVNGFWSSNSLGDIFRHFPPLLEATGRGVG